ncbi:MAG: GntG family PLP-dependent aldolase [Acidimicrobiia bacterium]|nr:MAG: GntG family PLP-dependent aldolase [Acidimicrobiia bacterium]
MIDLRSDTVTRPTDAMRTAMAIADVGDDVFGDDPTVNELERTVAELLGKEDAVYVPSGVMANQIALRSHTTPGDLVVTEAGAHIRGHESGGPAALSGVTIMPVPGRFGVFTAEQFLAAAPPPPENLPSALHDPVALVTVENTHMEAGGTIWPLEAAQAIVEVARERGIATHLDGARLWNATAATGIPEATYAEGFDTVSVCFSKGLGAPIGSAVAGSADTIDRARRYKKMYGGGFRQAGIIAAGALYGIEHHRRRLVADHDNARRFGDAVVEIPDVEIDLAAIHTNIVYFSAADAQDVVDRCATDGVAMLAMAPTRVRAVFHLDVSGDDTDRAIEVVTKVMSGHG